MKKVLIFLVLIISLWADTTNAEIFGDVNNDGIIDLIDAIVAIKVVGNNAVSSASLGADINGDERIGLEDAIYIEQVLAGLRENNDHDIDNDGFTENQGDCNDRNSSIFPGANEICGDDIDQDCSGIDTICPEDIDNDGDGFTENQGDCDDTNPNVKPGATEICGDHIDQDCDGMDLSCLEALEGNWINDSVISNVTNQYVSNGSQTNKLEITDNEISYIETTYWGSNYTGDLFKIETWVYRLDIGTEKITFDGEFVTEIKLTTIDYYWQPFSQLEINDYAANYYSMCGFVPSPGQIIHENDCNIPSGDRYAGQVKFGIFQIENNLLYLNGNSENYPDYLNKTWTDRYLRQE